jgi:hypothetical protein
MEEMNEPPKVPVGSEGQKAPDGEEPVQPLIDPDGDEEGESPD